MRTLSTDQGSPFTAKVFEVIRKLFGVKVHNFTSQGDSIALGDTEQENKWIQKAISEAGSKGDIANLVDFKLYLARVVMERNQIMVIAGSTVFERIHGFKALTVGDIIMNTKELESGGKLNLAEYDATVVPVLAKNSKALVEAYQAYRNDRNFKAAFDRDFLYRFLLYLVKFGALRCSAYEKYLPELCSVVCPMLYSANKCTRIVVSNPPEGDQLRSEKIQYRKMQTDVLTEGDMVTWINSNKNAEKGLLVKVNIKGGVKMSAVVDTGGQRKKVQYSALHQLAAKRPQMLLDLDVRLDEGMMAFWRCNEGELIGGVITDADTGSAEMEIHYYEANHNMRKWLPLWQVDEDSDCFRGQDCPEGMQAAVQVLPRSIAKKSGFIKESGYITEDTLLMLQAWLQE